MKKFFVVTSVLLMCCMFMGCGVKAKLDGTWKANKSGSRQVMLDAIIETDYTSFETRVPGVTTSEDNITLTINKDGTFSQEVVTTQTSVVEDYVYESYPDTKITLLSEDGKTYYKMYGNWYYDNDKIILKITNYSEQYNDEDPVVDTNVDYRSAELYLIDDILFATLGGGIYEFTKAE